MDGDYSQWVTVPMSLTPSHDTLTGWQIILNTILRQKSHVAQASLELMWAGNDLEFLMLLTLCP